jgi:hypothetical protein
MRRAKATLRSTPGFPPTTCGGSVLESRMTLKMGTQQVLTDIPLVALGKDGAMNSPV